MLRPPLAPRSRPAFAAIVGVLAGVLISCAGAAPQPHGAPPGRSADAAPLPRPNHHAGAPDPGLGPPSAGHPPARDDESIDRPTSDPYDGDLSIFEQPGRADRLQIDRVMTLLGIDLGSTVADVGAGSGWFTVRAARRVGANGAVYAVEINPRFIEYIATRAAKERLGNVRTVLATADDPRLPDQSLDAVLLLKTYHEIEKPIAVLKRIRRAMRPRARLGIIDKKGSGDDHGIDGDVVIREAARAGFELLERHDFVKRDGLDYFLIFRPAGG